MREITIEFPDGKVVPAALATSFRDRWLGLGASGIDTLALPTTSVHTFHLRRSIELVACDAEGTVIGVRTLPPRRVTWLRGASLVVELPEGFDTPEVGERLVLGDG